MIETCFSLEASPLDLEWTCKKCTLVNVPKAMACVVCGGSKLKSISSVEDMTLRKGEFWQCSQCTLKNSLSTNVCIACKAVRSVPIISGQQTNYRPYTSTHSDTSIAPNNNLSQQHQNVKNNLAISHNRQMVTAVNASSSSGSSQPAMSSSSFSTSQNSSSNSQNQSQHHSNVTNSSNLFPPTARSSRSPSPRHERTSSGAVPKVS